MHWNPREMMASKLIQLDFRGRSLMLLWSWGRPGEVDRIRVFVGEKTADLFESTEFPGRQGFQNDLVSVPFYQNLAPIEAECSRQTDRLAAAVSEDFRSGHCYYLYLHVESVNA